MVHLKWIEIDWKSEVVKAWGISSGGNYWFHFDGQTHEVIDQAKGTARSRSKAQSGNDIKAPMPGKIIKILAQAGDSVTQGQVLAIMEAMKMEYTLKAPKDGKVKSVNCGVNQQVQLNQVLVALHE